MCRHFDSYLAVQNEDDTIATFVQAVWPFYLFAFVHGARILSPILLLSVQEGEAGKGRQVVERHVKLRCPQPHIGARRPSTVD